MSQASNIKTFKKGDVLFKEGDRCTNIWIIQSGQVALQLHRSSEKGKAIIDFATNLGPGQVVGDSGLSGANTYPYSAIATAETKAVELPVDSVKQQIEAFPQLAKVIQKSLIDRLKTYTSDLKSFKLERDQVPCSPEQTPKVFGSIYATLFWKGEPTKTKDGVEYWTILWPTLKNYSQRVFAQLPKRVENAVNLLVKMGHAKYILGKNEETEEEEIQKVQFFKRDELNIFIDFYQHYYFKNGKTDLLKYDERTFMIASGIFKAAGDAQPDRTGIVRIDYAKAMEVLKESTGIQLNNDHFTVLETKGLYFKRHTAEKGIELQFEIAELKKMISIWTFIREIDRWNEKGSVDPNEPVQTEKAKVSKDECPACHKPILAQAKFCSECGHKIVQAA